MGHAAQCALWQTNKQRVLFESGKPVRIRPAAKPKREGEMSDHTPKIKKPTDEELNAAIGHAETKGMYGLMGALLELKQRRAQDKAGADAPA